MAILCRILLLASLLTLSHQCSTDEDCNLNGICNTKTNTCDCDPGWKATDCGVLDIRPGPRSNGYNRTDEHISSWGSKIIKDPKQDGLWHAFMAEFTHHCGLDYWSPYSRIIRTESTTGPLGPYSFVSEVVGHFAHNPTVVYSAADKEYLMYYIGCPRKVDTEKCHEPKTFTCGPGNFINGESGISVQKSKDLVSWEFVGQVFKGMNNKDWDADTTNPSPFPLGDTPFNYGGPNDKASAEQGSGDGSHEMLLAYRGCPYNCSGNEQITLAKASTYNGPYTRLNNNKPIFDNPAEDPFIWRDKRGNYHILVHALGPNGGFGSGPKVGRHAYSRSIDGPWTYNTNTLAFSTVTEFDDGSKIDYYRKERPQLLFSNDGEMRPLVLTNGVQEKHSGMSYSLMVPIGD